MKHTAAFADAVDRGLSATQKFLPTRFIYDDNGSKLFEKIMQLPEYYLTRAEHKILGEQKQTFAQCLPSGKFNLVELGAGNGAKTMTLLRHFHERSLPFRYVPIDISKGAIDGLTKQLATELPDLQVEGLTMEYFEGLQWLKEHSKRRNFVLFMGSNIGNFLPDETDTFLQGLHDSLNKGDYLSLGVDLKKDYEKIRKAYYDSAGVTKAFNMNLIHRINRELGGNFQVDAMEYYAAYNPLQSRNEAYLYSRKDQEITIAENGKTYQLKAWEPISTEYSYKYSIEDLQQLAESHQFKVITNLIDKNCYFVDSIWRIYEE